MKKFLKYILLTVLLLSNTGCILGRDAFDDIDIYTTTYVTEFLTQELYGNNSTIRSIYPDGINPNDYTLTPRQINEFSRGNLFIYNGLGSERQIARDFINSNAKLNIIDVGKGFRSNDEQLWISPSHTLMVAQNIRNGLNELITNTSLLEEVSKNYEQLQILLSGFDAEFNLTSANATNRTIVVANEAFNFLNRYNFDVINIDVEGDTSTNAYDKALRTFRSGENKAVFILQGTEITNEIQSLINAGATLVYVHPMLTLSDEERRDGKNYVTFMEEFLEAIRTEVF